jgi:hypothetical protein
MFMTGMPAACNLSTAHLGGTPTAETNSFAFSLMMTSISSGSLPSVLYLFIILVYKISKSKSRVEEEENTIIAY